MAKSKRRSAFEDSDYFDQMLDQAQVAAAEEEARASGRTGKGKPAHAGTLGVDQAGRSKATYDITEATQTAIREIAQAEECHISDIAEAALRLFVVKHQAGQIDLHPYKVPTRSLKAIWRLELPPEIDFFSD